MGVNLDESWVFFFFFFFFFCFGFILTSPHGKVVFGILVP